MAKAIGYVIRNNENLPYLAYSRVYKCHKDHFGRLLTLEQAKAYSDRVVNKLEAGNATKA